MKISILTMCPEMFGDYLRTHAVTRAAGLGLAEVEVLVMILPSEGAGG